MSDPADSALDAGEATGADVTQTSNLADSTPTPGQSGQEQGDQSKRVNGLMSLAQKRTAERDAALNEIEVLRQQLDEATLAEQSAMETSQIESMYPERFAEPEPDEPEEPEPERVLMEPNQAMRPDAAKRSTSPVTAPPMTPGERYVRDRGEIAALTSRLNEMGNAWARESGLLD